MTAVYDIAVEQEQPASDTLADEMILLALLLGRFSARTAKLIEEELRGLADELVRIVANNDFSQVKMEAARTQRLRRLLDEADIAIRNSLGAAGRTLINDVKLAIEVAAEHAAASLNTAMGFDIARPIDKDRVLALAGILLIEGKSAIEWWKKIAGDAKFRFTAIIRDGYQRKLSLEEMVAAIRGTGDKQFANGFLGTTWRAAAALARTAVAAGAEAAQEFQWNAHSAVVGAVIQVSILDFRTSDVCRRYSRKIWTVPGYEPVDHSLPYAGGTPRHWRCRSSILPIILPFDRLSPRHQARIALQQRQSAFNGASPADLEFEDWLRAQATSRQKAALGGRYGLWKAGTLSVEDMLDPTFNPVSIRELRKILGLD